MLMHQELPRRHLTFHLIYRLIYHQTFRLLHRLPLRLHPHLLRTRRW